MRPAIGGMPAPKTRDAASMKLSSSMIFTALSVLVSKDSVNTEQSDTERDT